MTSSTGSLFAIESESSLTDLPFLIGAELGQGGFATVHRAISLGGGPEVALKRPRPDVPGAAERLAREIECLLRAPSEYIVRILQADEASRWYTMDVASGTLKTTHARLLEYDQLRLAHRMARALLALEKAGVVHRDITPANLLAFRQPNRSYLHKLADLGLGRRPRGLTTALLTRGGIGTAGFVAPEVRADAHAADHQTDIYSLGRTFEFMLTGRFPDGGSGCTVTGPWSSLITCMTCDARNERLASGTQILEALPGIRDALMDEREAGAAARSSFSELDAAERAVLSLVVGEAFEDGIIREYIETSLTELSPTSISIALHQLLQRGFVVRYSLNDGENTWVYRAEQDGLQWCQEHKHVLNL